MCCSAAVFGSNAMKQAKYNRFYNSLQTGVDSDYVNEPDDDAKMAK